MGWGLSVGPCVGTGLGFWVRVMLGGVTMGIGMVVMAVILGVRFRRGLLVRVGLGRYVCLCVGMGLGGGLRIVLLAAMTAI